jgi:hypothetical protein
MTTITLEVPDELVAQLRMDPTLLPALLQEAIHTKRAKGPLPATSAVSGPPLYQEIVTTPRPKASGFVRNACVYDHYVYPNRLSPSPNIS